METYKYSAVKRWISIMLIIAMVLSSLAPFNRVHAEEEKVTNGVTVSIEKVTEDGMAYLQEPTNIHYESIKYQGRFPKAKDVLLTVFDGSIITEMNNIYQVIVKSVTDSAEASGILENGAKGDKSQWVCLQNSKVLKDLDARKIQDGNIIRLIYTLDGGADIGLADDGSLQVNKDALMTKYAITPSEEQSGAAYQRAGDVLKNLTATQSEVDSALDILENGGGETPEVPSNPITISPAKTALYPEETVQLNAEGSENITWKSDNEATATVNDKGLVTARAEGKAVITASEGARQAAAAVVVMPKDEEKDLKNVAVSIENNGELVIEPTLVPQQLDPGKPNSVLGHINQALKKAGVSGRAKTNIMSGKITSMPTKSGEMIDNSKDGRALWLSTTVNKSFEDTTMTRPEAGTVARAIFSVNSGTDIGIGEDNMLAVNKDALIFKSAQINEDKSILDSDAKKAAYESALSTIKNVSVDQTVVDTAYRDLRAAFVEYPDINIPSEVIPATGISIVPENGIVHIKDILQMVATLEPADANDKIIWTSSDESKANISSDGVVTGVKEGTVEITAVAGKVSKTVKVTVVGTPAEEVSINQTTASVEEGKYFDLIATVKPENTTDELVWSSEDPAIATVSGTGRVIGQKAGKVNIKAVAGQKEAVCEVMVTARKTPETPKVCFRYKDGRIQDMDADNTFTLTVIDEGSFFFEGTDKPTTWYCSEDYQEDGYDGTHFWINNTGEYSPHGIKQMDASGSAGNVGMTFKINTVASNVEELVVYNDGKPVSEENPLTVAGSEVKLLDLRGRRTGEQEYINIPAQAYKGKALTDYSSISIDGYIQLRQIDCADFTVSMLDNSNVKANFQVKSIKVPVQSFDVTVPEVWYIDGWNILGGYYVGITDRDEDGYKLKITPENATNKEIDWKALNPEVAEYMVMFANGIVPKKAGKASFELTSKDNPSLKKTVSVEFKYKTPLKSVSMDKSIEVEQYQSVRLHPVCLPEDATEQRFNWTYSEDGIVEIAESIVRDEGGSLQDVHADHALTAKKAGTVTVTGTPFDTTGGAQPITFTVTVNPSGGGESIDYAKMAKEDLKHGRQYLESDGIEKSAYGDEWSIFTTLRSGGTIAESDLEAYYESVKTKVNSSDLDRLQPTDRARVILTLSAMGKDPTDIGGIDLIERTYNDTSLATQSSNQISWSIIALDSKKYETPERALWNRDKLVSELLEFQKETGGFGLSKEGTGDSIDMTAMVLQALAPYNDAEHQEVQAAFEKGLSYIKAKLTSNCGFIEGGSENGCTGAQVLTLLSIAKIDPLSETNGFTLGKKNLITNLDSFKLESGGFKTYAANEDEPDGVKLMSSQQVTYALEAYDRFVNNENSLYDLTDVGNEGPVDPPVDPDKEKDKAAAKAVTDQILAIGEITSYEQKATVDAARQAYNKLTRAQKAYVTEETLKVLTDAEAAIKALAPLKGTVNFDVERFTIGQGFYKEPVQVPFYEGETGTEIIKRVIGDENFVGQDSYLEAIKGADAGSDKLRIPAYIVQKLNGADTEAARTFGNDYADSALGQFSYSQESGWMYYVNNVEMPYGINAYQPKDGDTMRLMFTYCGYGKDLSGKDYGSSEAIAKIANKDRLIAAAAAMNTPQATAANTISADSEAVKLAYDRALKAIENMTLSQEATDKAEKDLKAAMAGDSSWVENIKAVEALEQSAEQFADYEAIRLKDKENVEKLIKDYEALSAEEKHSVLNMTYLEAAKIQLEALENAEKAMNEQVQVVKKALAGNYTQKSSEAVRVVLAQAEALDTQTADAEAMKQMAKELSDSLKILVPAADKTGLAESLEKADAVTGSYTQETWQPFLKARVAARELMKNNNLKAEEQNVVESAKAELDRTMDALIAVGDKTDLGEIIAEMEKVNTSPYTKASGEAFKEALEAAKAVYNDPNATEAQISEAMTALKNAKLALAPKSQGEDPEKADSEQAKKNAEASGKNVSTGILEDDMSSAFTCAALLAMISLAGTVAVRKRKEQ